MKKLAFVALFLCLSAMLFAAGFLSANDLEPQSVVETAVFEEIFVFNANAEKPTLIENTDERTAPDEEIFNVRIKLNGTGKPNQYSIDFPAIQGEKLTVYLNSSSKTDERVLQVLDVTANKVVATIAAPPATAEMKAGMGSVEIPADGTYRIQSAKSGIYVYSIVLE